ncbi:hypothetical protein [Streptomyces sp. NPDC003710]
MSDNDIPPQPDIPPAPTAPPAEPPAFAAQAPAKRRPGPLSAGLVGLALGAGIVGGAWAISANSGPGAFTLEGSFELTDSVIPDGEGGCAGTRGYDDIRDGTSVTVYNAAGSVVGTGALSNSKYGEDTYNCTFDVTVNDVPKGEKFYKVEVSHRGTLQLTADEAEGGQFGGTLG